MIHFAIVLAALCGATSLLAAATSATPASAPGGGEGRITAQSEPARRTEVLLRKIIEELRRGVLDADSLEPAVESAVRQQLPAITGLLERFGELQSLELAGTRGGADVYRVSFRRGVTSWTIALSPGGKIAALLLRPAERVETQGEEVSTAGLSGTLIRPPGAARPPVVLLIAGSGPTDRNGNQHGTGPAALRQLAEALAGHGIATLRYDKRGVGRSSEPGMREEDIDLERSVDDAAAWLSFVEQRGEFGPAVVAGHSEGGVLGMLVAARGKVGALVLLATPGRPLSDVLRDQLRAALAPALLDEALAIIAALERGESVAQVSAPLMGLFRPSVQPFLRSAFAIDPARKLAELTQPVLIVSGGHDLQVGETDAAALAAARPDAVRLHVASMNHVLKIAPPDRAGQERVYLDPSLPLAPGLIEAIVEFARRRAG